MQETFRQPSCCALSSWRQSAINPEHEGKEVRKGSVFLRKENILENVAFVLYMFSNATSVIIQYVSYGLQHVNYLSSGGRSTGSHILLIYISKSMKVLASKGT